MSEAPAPVLTSAPSPAETPTPPPDEITAPPPSDETPDLVTPPEEAAPEKEIPRERQVKEVEYVANSILYRGLQRVKEKVARGEALTSGERELQTLIHIDEMKAGEHIDFDGSLKRTVTVETTTTGVERKSNGVLKRADSAESADELSCKFKTESSERPEVTITMKRRELRDLQLFTHQDAILDTFTGVERDLIRQYILLQKDPDSPLPSDINDLIKKAAKETGIITVEDLVSLQQAIEGKLSDKSTPEEKDLSERLKKIGAEGNLLDFSTISSVFSELGLSPSVVDLKIKGLEKVLTEAKERLTANPKNERLLADYEDAKGSLLLMQQAAEALKPEGALKQYFDLANQGALDLDTAKKFAENFRLGNIDDIISKLPGMENLTLDKKWELLKKNKAKEGLLILLILALMGTVSATDFIKIPQR